MARQNPSNNKAGAGEFNILLLVAILVLLILVGVAAYFLWRQQHRAATPPPPSSAPSATTTPATTAPTEPLISDNGIIFGGMPRSTRPDVSFTVLKNIAYIVGYSERRKDPLWSAYHVIHMEHPFTLPRPKGEFLTDTRTTAMIKHHDFTGSGFDRGHMTPNSAIARCFGADAQAETFLLSNICPQSGPLNQKVWEKLEMAEIDYADADGTVWVTDGPIFADMNGGSTRTLPAGIAVPSAFYKILVEQPKGSALPRVFSVIMPQLVKGTELPGQYVTSIAEIEKETGLEFLWKLPPQVRAQLIGKVWPMWGRGE